MAESNPNPTPSAVPPLPISPFCGQLRSKKYYFLEGPAMAEGDILDASNDCWCARTMQKIGPDGKVVDAPDCQRGRSCFESV